MTHLAYSAHREAFNQGQFIRVVNYHNTPRTGTEKLRAELAALSGRFATVSEADLDRLFATGEWDHSKPGFLPVFYEGYRNSAEVAATVCDELGLTAWFFVCTAFVDTPVIEQEAFARSHFIGLVPEEFGRDRLALTWDEIDQLSQRHVVSAHTASHAGIADVVTEEDFEREVHAPKRKLDAVIGRSSPAFAWLHGSPFGTSARHDDAVRAAGYRYQFSNTMIHRVGS